ncbi:MAG: DUF4245 domain-containing protein [Actinobacteria bacterium]|nr:DUF4245 domain-containing protein [Actinomycetota bacterium]
MAEKQKTPVIVAELGRPETPRETAARKAETSRLYRQRKTVNNLVFSLLVTLGVVVLIVLFTPQGANLWKNPSIDVSRAAAEAAPTAGQELVAPAVPEGWEAKQAQLRGGGGKISFWYLGYTTADESYAAVAQAFTSDGSKVDDSWVAQQLESQAATGTESIGGFDWTVYDHSDRSADNTNASFGLTTQIGTTTLVVYGTDTPEAIRSLAKSVAEEAARIAPDGDFTRKAAQ